MSFAQNLAVLVVDLQADFTSAHQGALAVAGADQAYLETVQEATRRLKGLGLPIYATQDWHPPGHVSFASSHPGRALLESLELPDGRSQVLWPDHAVQHSPGARLLQDPALLTAVVQKGTHPDYDSYSGFQDDGGGKTGLDEVLRLSGVDTLVCYGLATDYCVKFTVLDALAAGFKVIVIQDLCRGVDPEGSEAAWQEMAQAGADLWPGLDLEKLGPPPA